MTESSVLRVRVVYAIEASNGLVKVGSTVNLPARFGAIRANSPIPVRVVETWEGTMADEFELHRRLAQHRMWGEWFDLPAGYVDLIDTHLTSIQSAEFVPTIRGLRVSRGWSRARLAREADITEQTIVRAEAGACSPSLGTLKAIAGAFGVDHGSIVLSNDTARGATSPTQSPRADHTGA